MVISSSEVQPYRQEVPGYTQLMQVMVTILSETQDSSAICNIKQVAAEENEVPITLTFFLKKKMLQIWSS